MPVRRDVRTSDTYVSFSLLSKVMIGVLSFCVYLFLPPSFPQLFGLELLTDLASIERISAMEEIKKVFESVLQVQ